VIFVVPEDVDIDFPADHLFGDRNEKGVAPITSGGDVLPGNSTGRRRSPVRSADVAIADLDGGIRPLDSVEFIYALFGEDAWVVAE